MIEYKFIGWNTTEGHDKVWGVIKLRDGSGWDNDAYCTFWGRRGKKLQTKVSVESEWDMEKLIASKTNKGYNGVEIDELNNVYPEFEADLKKTTFWAQFKI